MSAELPQWFYSYLESLKAEDKTEDSQQVYQFVLACGDTLTGQKTEEEIARLQDEIEDLDIYRTCPSHGLQRIEEIQTATARIDCLETEDVPA